MDRANVFVLCVCAGLAHAKLQLEFSIQGVGISRVTALKTDEVYSHVVCSGQLTDPTLRSSGPSTKLNSRWYSLK